LEIERKIKGIDKQMLTEDLLINSIMMEMRGDQTTSTGLPHSNLKAGANGGRDRFMDTLESSKKMTTESKIASTFFYDYEDDDSKHSSTSDQAKAGRDSSSGAGQKNPENSFSQKIEKFYNIVTEGNHNGTGSRSDREFWTNKEISSDRKESGREKSSGKKSNTLGSNRFNDEKIIRPFIIGMNSESQKNTDSVSSAKKIGEEEKDYDTSFESNDLNFIKKNHNVIPQGLAFNEKTENLEKDIPNVAPKLAENFGKHEFAVQKEALAGDDHGTISRDRKTENIFNKKHLTDIAKNPAGIVQPKPHLGHKKNAKSILSTNFISQKLTSHLGKHNPIINNNINSNIQNIHYHLKTPGSLVNNQNQIFHPNYYATGNTSRSLSSRRKKGNLSESGSKREDSSHAGRFFDKRRSSCNNSDIETARFNRGDGMTTNRDRNSGHTHNSTIHSQEGDEDSFCNHGDRVYNKQDHVPTAVATDRPAITSNSNAAQNFMKPKADQPHFDTDENYFPVSDNRERLNSNSGAKPNAV
jgi:hypothetical protein